MNIDDKKLRKLLAAIVQTLNDGMDKAPEFTCPREGLELTLEYFDSYVSAHLVGEARVEMDVFLLSNRKLLLDVRSNGWDLVARESALKLIHQAKAWLM